MITSWFLPFIIVFCDLGPTTAGQQIVISPPGPQQRAIGKQITFICTVTGVARNVDPHLRWKGVDGRDIIETTGKVYVEKDGLRTLKLHITDLKKNHAGEYTCYGTIRGNRMDKATKLMVYKDISFDNAPSPQYPVIFTNAIIVCEVSGDPSPVVSWRRKGRTIRNNEKYLYKKNGLQVRNITEEDNGVYECRAEVPEEGRTATRFIDVKVKIRPQIVISPTGPQYRLIGKQIVFKCTVTGMAPNAEPHLRWKGVDGRDIIKTTGKMYVEKDGLQTLKLYITDIKNIHIGKYTCYGTINGNQVENTTKLLLYKDINFDYAPSPQYPVIFTNAIIVCEVSGAPSPVVSWRRKGRTIRNNEKYVYKQKGLQVRNITEEDNGVYECRAEVPEEGRAATKYIYVKVKMGQQIVISPTGPQYRLIGRQVVFTCTVTGIAANVDPRLRGKGVDGRDIIKTTGKVYVEKDGLQKLKLYITDIKSIHIGKYTCYGTISGNRVENTTKLLLYKAISFDYAPSPQYPVIFTNAIILCKVSGAPSPVVSWRHKGRTIRNNEKYVYKQNGLQVRNITQEDNGVYECRAEVPEEGRAATKYIYVKVKSTGPVFSGGDHCRQRVSTPLVLVAAVAFRLLF